MITQDRLKKFNQIQGTFAGNVTEEIVQQQQEAAAEHQEQKEDAQAEAEEAGDEVDALDEENKQEVLSQRAQDVLSQAPSRRSNATSKTYISKLERQLEQEKLAR